MTVSDAMTAGYIAPDSDVTISSGKPYTDVVNLVIKFAKPDEGGK